MKSNTITTLTGKESSMTYSVFIPSSYERDVIKVPSQCSAIDVDAEYVYNIVTGKIAFVGNINKVYGIVVEVNANEVIRYSNLKNVQFNAGDMLYKGTKIGNCYKFVRVEYGTSWPGASRTKLHVNNKVYYLQDPSDIMNDSYVPKLSYGVPPMIDSLPEEAHYSDTFSKTEFGNNRGE